MFDFILYVLGSESQKYTFSSGNQGIFYGKEDESKQRVFGEINFNLANTICTQMEMMLLSKMFFLRFSVSILIVFLRKIAFSRTLRVSVLWWGREMNR